MNCKYVKCGKPLPSPAPGGRREREYCNNACKQAHYRLLHQQDQAQGSTLTEIFSELVELRQTCHDQAQRITELEQENTRLLGKLDVERRFREDHEKRGFRTWLKKQPAARVGEVGRRIQSDDLLPAAGSRWFYEAHLRKNGYTTDEIEQVRDLWKLMLLS